MMNSLWTGMVAVGAGSMLGGLARWGLSAWLNPRHALFAWGTFAANAAGGLLVGLAVAHFAKHPDPAWRLFVITGFLGGLTTFSTYSAEVVSLIERGEFGWAFTVAAVHLAASFALTAAGYWLYRQAQ